MCEKQSAIPRLFESMKRLFKIGSDRHDIGYVSFSWHSSEFGDILELRKQCSEAPSMLLKARNLEKAAEIFIRDIITQDKNKLNEAIGIMSPIAT